MRTSLSIRLQTLIARWSTLVPSECLLCGQSRTPHESPDRHAAFCAHCETAFWAPEAAILRCRQCAIRLALQSPAARGPVHDATPLTNCAHCLRRAPAFDAAVALADYRAPLDSLAIALKYQGRLSVAALLAERLAPAIEALQAKDRPELLLPVPLSSRRLAARGYNQAWELARRLGKRAGIAATAKAMTRRHTSAQAGLHRAARETNLSEVFTVAPHAAPDLQGRHVGVVDDVMTTGATQQAIALALKAAGASRVTAIVVFRTA